MILTHSSSFIGANGRPSALSLFYPSDQFNLPVLLFAHGFKGFKDWGHFPMICNTFAQAGFAVLAFNFSHNGGTAEEPIDFPDLEAFSKNTLLKEVDDIKRLLGWLSSTTEIHKGSLDLQRLNILGHSRGGAIAIIAAARFSQIKKVISWAAVADFIDRFPSKSELLEWEETGFRIIKNGRTKQEMPVGYAYVQELLNHSQALSVQRACESLAIPQFVIHGSKDETVPVSDAQAIHHWNPNSELLLIEGANHTFDGKHPWVEEKLPSTTEIAVSNSIAFLKA